MHPKQDIKKTKKEKLAKIGQTTGIKKPQLSGLNDHY
jgi:hypothetical protein